MSFSAVRKLTVVSFFVIGGLLIFGNLFAGTSPYSNLPWSTVDSIWGSTYDDKPGNFNKGMYFAAWGSGPGNPNPDYTVMPQEDTSYPREINAPFDMAGTSWSASTADVATVNPLFQSFDAFCNPSTQGGAIYGMNDTDHIYIAIQVEADQINSADRLYLYFDPDNIQPVAQFVEGSGYTVGVKLGDCTIVEGVSNTVLEGMEFSNGYWRDWNGSGSIDTWEAGYPWPRPGDTIGAQTHPMEIDSGDRDDLTIVPRDASEWGDGGEIYPGSGAYWMSVDTLKTWGTVTSKGGALMMEFKIPIANLGCALPLGSAIGFAVQWLDDMTPYNGVINECSPEFAWWPTDIEKSGPYTSTPEWEETDATYMGTYVLNSLNEGNRLWGSWYQINDDRTSFLVLKNVSDEIAKTKVKFYQSLHGDASERWAPLPGAGDLILGSQCLEIPPHGVTTLQLETLGVDPTNPLGGILNNTEGCIEVTNVNLSGYVTAYVGLDSGATQKYAWSTDLERSPLTTDEFNTATGFTQAGMMLTNKWYIVGEIGWDFDTSVVIVNPSSTNTATASMVLYPSVYWNPAAPSTKNLCADGFSPDFDDDYVGSGACGDDTGDVDDVINIPPHQAVEIGMWELLNQWVASLDGTDVSSEITNPTNAYFHFRKGTVEIHVQDGDDVNTNRLNESLLGISVRESVSQGWGESLSRYYE